MVRKKRKKEKQTVHWIYLMGIISVVIILNSVFIIMYMPPRHVCYPEIEGNEECTAFCISLPEEDLVKYSGDCRLSSKEIIGTCLPSNRCDCYCMYKPLDGIS
jgi:hypothetical protein